MRFILAGLILFCTSAAVLAQAEGEVESIGFEGLYRANCWTPMRLTLRPKIGQTRTYKIAVVQEDLDRDRVIYSRPFTLNGNPEGRQLEEKVWVYFLPQPRDLEAMPGPELSAILKVFLCDADSGKQLVQIPVPRSVKQLQNLEERVAPTGFGGGGGDLSVRGRKLVLIVADSSKKPTIGADIYANARGITETIIPFTMTPSELPGSVLALEAVDSIIWLDADPAMLKADSLAAIQDFVADGGKLVVSTGSNWQRIKESALAPLLPVDLEQLDHEENVRSLRQLAELPDLEDWKRQMAAGQTPVGDFFREPWITRNQLGLWKLTDPWSTLEGAKQEIIRAKARPGAMVNMFSVSQPTSPYLARWMQGFGSVAWVAQDLGDPANISKSELRDYGWEKVWDRVMDWKNDTITTYMHDGGPAGKLKFDPWVKAYETTYGNGQQQPSASYTDVSLPLYRQMEVVGTGAAYVAIAILVLIGYWLAAGPGSYFFLLSKKRSQYSWVAFAVCAVAATGLTVVVVKIALRGGPQLHHISFVRVNQLGDQRKELAYCDFGLYIKRDGEQRLELTDTEPKRNSYVTPYPLPYESWFKSPAGSFPAFLEYEIPIRDRTATDNPAISVPYRTTLKKFQAKWIGSASGGIDGTVTLGGNNRLRGKLVNNSGTDLWGVSMIYARDANNAQSDDMLLQLHDLGGGPGWKSGATLDLDEFISLHSAAAIAGPDRNVITRDEWGRRGLLNGNWQQFWHSTSTSSSDTNLHGRPTDVMFENLDHAALLMSIFDRLKPSTKSISNNSTQNDRYEILRRAGRKFDASQAVSAGHLLIIGHSGQNSPLPVPLKVEGSPVQGEGYVYYQFILPLQRNGEALSPIPLPTPATQPATRPVTASAGR